jgi:MYXO-CTERM domain-containing protein
VRHAFLAAAVASCLLAAAPTASANGRFPASNALLFSPTNPQLVILRTTFGILPSYDYGTTWTWLCEDTLGLPPTANEDPNLGLTKTNALIAGLSLGLEVSPDTGCSWTTVDGGGLAGQLVKDIVVRPDAPDTILAVTSTFEPDAGLDGGQGYTQYVYSSTNDGAQWSKLGTIDPGATVTTIEVAASDPQRVYVSAFRGEGMQRTVSIFVSKDAGQTWTEHVLPSSAYDPNTESAIYIAAVDPGNADLLYIRSEGASRLTVSKDGAQTFQQPFTMPQGDEMEGFALSPDGTKIWVGGPNTGLFSAATSDYAFSQVSSIHVQCLATRGTDLWACSDEPSGFIAGISQDDGKTFTAKLHLTTIAGPMACPPTTTAGALCTTTDYDAEIPYNPFGSLCTNLGACYEAGTPQPLTTACDEAGACGPQSASSGGGSGSSGGSGSGSGGAGGDAGTGGKAKSSSCGCSVVGGGGAAGALFGLAVAAIATRRRRRR